MPSILSVTISSIVSGESPTNDFREKEENQTSHTGMELNNYFLERTSLQRKPPDHFQKEIEQELDKNQGQC
jgi:hypothetical protein